MSNRVGEPTRTVTINGIEFWLVPYHIDNKDNVAYMLKPVEQIELLENA